MNEGKSKGLDWSNAAVFWMLSALGLGTLGACLLLPVNRQYLEAREEHRAMYQQVQQLQQQVKQANFLIEAARTDPQYNEFIARNELNYRKPGQESITLQVEDPDIRQDKEKPLQGSFLPDTQRWWYAIFLQKRSQVILLIMGGVCLVVAILICNRPKQQIDG